jgi:hypothetical protein
MNEDITSPTVICSFVISGRNFDPEGFSRLIEVQPTRIWRQQNPSLVNRAELPTIEWRFQIQYDSCNWLNHPIQDILNHFTLYQSELRSFVEQHNCASHLLVKVRGDLEGIDLSVEANTLEQLCKMGARLCFAIEATD